MSFSYQTETSTGFTYSPSISALKVGLPLELSVEGKQRAAVVTEIAEDIPYISSLAELSGCWNRKTNPWSLPLSLLLGCARIFFWATGPVHQLSQPFCDKLTSRRLFPAHGYITHTGHLGSRCPCLLASFRLCCSCSISAVKNPQVDAGELPAVPEPHSLC